MRLAVSTHPSIASASLYVRMEMCPVSEILCSVSVFLNYDLWMKSKIWLVLDTVLFIKKVKVKVTLVQALKLCTGRTAHRGSRGIAVLFHDHGTRRRWGGSVTPRPFFAPGKDPVPIVQEAGWAPGPVWTGSENFAPTGIRSPDRPARS
jgi:hypothetical protein